MRNIKDKSLKKALVYEKGDEERYKYSIGTFGGRWKDFLEKWERRQRYNTDHSIKANGSKTYVGSLSIGEAIKYRKMKKFRPRTIDWYDDKKITLDEAEFNVTNAPLSIKFDINIRFGTSFSDPYTFRIRFYSDKVSKTRNIDNLTKIIDKQENVIHTQKLHSTALREFLLYWVEVHEGIMASGNSSSGHGSSGHSGGHGGRGGGKR